MYRRCLAGVLLLLISRGSAQNGVVLGQYKDAKTGVSLSTWTPGNTEQGGSPFTFGLALPGDALSKNSTEYIGMLRCRSVSANATGWCGIGHAGGMTKDLLLMAWPYQGQILTSFRWAEDYFPPLPYTASNASVTQISATVNATGFELIYRCQNCFSWPREDEVQTIATTEGRNLFGFAQATLGPSNPGCPGKIGIEYHDNGFGLWMAEFENATSSSYAGWAALAKPAPAGTCVSGGA